MIEAKLLKRFRAARDASAFLLNVDFQAHEGVTVLFGPSGAGKTLILDLLAGFARPDEGRILLNGRILFDAQAKVWVRPQERSCGYVFQNYALFPNMTARGNLLFANPSQKRAAEMLDRFRLSDVAGKLPHQLSGGQRQRCSIARALAGRPRVLLLDEPARGLDAPLRAELYGLLRDVRREFGTPVLLVTHDLQEAFELADQMLVIRDGTLVQTGSPAAICQRPANAELARLLGIYNVLPVEIRLLDPARNKSTLRLGEYEIEAEYFPGCFKGDRMHLLVSPRQLHAVEQGGKPGLNQIPAALEQVISMPEGYRLQFSGGLQVDAPPGTAIHNGDWLVQFPNEGLRVI